MPDAPLTGAGCAGMFTIVFVILGIVGTVLHANARKNQYEYNTETQCFLLDKTSTQICDANSDLDAKSKTCYYDEWFLVQYPISNGNWLNTSIRESSSSDPRRVQVGNYYPCFYSRTNSTSVQWEQNSHINGKIILMVGWIGTTLSVIGLEISLYYLLCG